MKCRLDSSKSGYSTLSWHLPPLGWLKFNVCGIAKEEATGCGGILKDEMSIARGLFTGPSAAKDSEEAKTEAILITLDIIVEMEWKISSSIIVEVGSKMV